MDEYISKQKAKDLMGCCLASAKAEYKAAKDVFTKARFGDYISAIQAMIDVVGAVEAADVQLVISGDNCIVCGRNVRKENVYYDVNGATVCESCMNTKCKCKNGR